MPMTIRTSSSGRQVTQAPAPKVEPVSILKSTMQRIRGGKYMRHAAATLTGKKLSINKTTAVLVWLFGAWLSARAGAQMAGYEISGWASPPIQLVLVACGAQWLLTRGQSPFWRWHLHNRAVPAHVTTIAIGSLTIDMLINAGGVWPLVQTLGKMDAW